MDPKSSEGSEKESKNKKNLEESQKKEGRRTSNLKGFYIVEKILDKKMDKNGVKYKIKWLNYPISESTWEPISNLVDPANKGSTCVSMMLAEFDEAYERKKPQRLRRPPIQESDDPENSPNNHPNLKSSKPSIDSDPKDKSPTIHSFKFLRKHAPNSKHSLSNSSLSSNSASESKGFPDPKLGKRRRENNFLENTEEIPKEKKEPSPARSIQSFKFKQKFREFKFFDAKEKGSFLYGDIAKRIVSVDFLGEEIMCQIEWSQRKNGETPKNSWHSNTFIKEFDPLLLVSYYESKITQLVPGKKNKKIKAEEETKEKETEQRNGGNT